MKAETIFIGTIVFFFSWIVFPSLLWSHGIVGQRVFIEPFATEDANPKNEFVISKPNYRKTPEGFEFSLGYSLEKKISDNFSIILETEWASIRPVEEEGTEGGNESHIEEFSQRVSRERGFDNLEVGLKYSFFESPAHEFRLSASLEMESPTGSRDIEAESHTALSPMLLYAKGFGDLPESLKYLRPLAVQGDLGFTTFPEVSGNTFNYDAIFQYSIPYLQTFVKDVGLKWPLSQLLPVAEFNFFTFIDGPEEGRTEAVARPGLVYLGEYVQLGLAAEIPMNKFTGSQVGIIGIINLFVDEIFLRMFRWSPF